MHSVVKTLEVGGVQVTLLVGVCHRGARCEEEKSGGGEITENKEKLANETQPSSSNSPLKAVNCISVNHLGELQTLRESQMLTLTSVKKSGTHELTLADYTSYDTSDLSVH